MKLDCKDISITDEELGCTIIFSQEKEEIIFEKKCQLKN